MKESGILIKSEANPELEESKREIERLISSYTESKLNRVAAVYRDTPLNQLHEVARWFNLYPGVPAKYHTKVNCHAKSKI